jgi:hypothetical protein
VTFFFFFFFFFFFLDLKFRYDGYRTAREPGFASDYTSKR